MSDLFDIPVTTIDGEPTTLKQYAGKTLLIVNTASKCGLTPQYKGLNALQAELGPKGLVVLGFPCNQFGGQEPGDEKQIAEFCELNYDIQFPLFSKIEVNGKGEHPLYAKLKSAAPGLLGSEAIKWNFTKFLVTKDGKILKRFAPTDEPASLKAEIEKVL